MINEQLLVNDTDDAAKSLPFKAVIFDMDGTLIESTEADYLAWKRIFEDNGRTLTYDDYKPLLGIKSANVVRDVLGVHNTEKARHLLATKLKYFNEVVAEKGILPVPGALDFVIHTSTLNVKVALATSSRSPKMNMIMNQLGFMPYFDATVTGEEVINSKPAPDIFLTAAKKLGVSPEECIVIEDALNGVLAAKAASMKCIAITTTHTAQQLETAADIVIDSFEETDIHEVCAKLPA